jgi:WD40 repeat protein
LGGSPDHAWSPDGKMVAARSNDDTVAVFDAGLRLLLPPAVTASGTIGSHRLDWAPNGQLLAVGYSDATARIWTVSP